jgi:hypothetical protein
MTAVGGVDRAAAVLLLVTVLLVGCGSSPTVEESLPSPTPVPGATGSSLAEPTGSASPTSGPSPTVAGLTLGQLATRVAEEWPAYQARWDGQADMGGSWSCEETSGIGPPVAGAPDHALDAGVVAVCRPQPPSPQGGDVPVVTVLVLDDQGTVSIAEGGLRFPLLHPNVIGMDFPSGLNCSQLLAPGSVFDEQATREGLTPTQRYFGTVTYWFLQDRPTPLMDIDQNGIPCQTLVSAAVVEQVWSGGWITPE